MAAKLVFLVFFAVFSIERISFSFRREQPGSVNYKWTTYALFATYFCCLFIALFQFLLSSVAIKAPLVILGFVLVILGLSLRRCSLKTLGVFWSRHIKLIAGQPLVKAGSYARIRNPYYLAVMLELFGWAILFNSSWALLFTLAVHLPALLYRINKEEKMLFGAYGAEYQAYKSKAGMFFPKLCARKADEYN